MNDEKNIYWNLFKSTFLISAFTIGGGYVIVPLLKSTFVDRYKWLENDETLDLVALAQSAPGVIAVNCSIILGYRLRGWRGALTTVVATIIPPLLIISVIAFFYDSVIHNPYIKLLLRGMQVAATAIILEVSVKLFLNIVKSREVIAIAMAISSFILGYFYQVNIMYIVIACATVGVALMRR